MPLIMISSNANHEVKLSKSLNQKKYRDKHKLFLAEGEKIISEALASNLEFYSIMILEGQDKFFVDLIDRIKIKNKNCKFFIIKQSALDTIANTKSPQHIIATINIPIYSSISDITSENLILILESIQDPSNMGSIIRSADALGANAIIFNNECADIYSPKCIRSAMGSTFHLPVVLSGSLEQEINTLKSNGFSIIATELSGSEKIEVSNNKIALIIGNEGKGVSQELLEASDHRFKLKMKGRTESLNASVAAALCMYILFN